MARIASRPTGRGGIGIERPDRVADKTLGRLGARAGDATREGT